MESQMRSHRTHRKSNGQSQDTWSLISSCGKSNGRWQGAMENQMNNRWRYEWSHGAMKRQYGKPHGAMERQIQSQGSMESKMDDRRELWKVKWIVAGTKEIRRELWKVKWMVARSYGKSNERSLELWKVAWRYEKAIWKAAGSYGKPNTVAGVSGKQNG